MIPFPSKFFVTGIDTGVGKTVVSSILCEALQADYWKPVQAGDLYQTDSMRVKALLSNSKSQIFPEAYCLQTPASPYIAASLDGIEIAVSQLKIPVTKNSLLIEGAGGIMVQLRANYLLLDFVQANQLPVIIVSKNYLGCINHTLLTTEVLKQRGIEILGLVFSGNALPAMQDAIVSYTKLPVLAQIPYTEKLDALFVKEQAMICRNTFIR